ncbi:pyridoxal-phosphate-dependent aminotransferase family protein [Planctomicrobium piriforme]|uniref:Alanine-glyoxylate transaminase / serine-glyoxylate transaminase / serine-pyruvate transaminase n=1 Tax=Planctomicrobium piriforme TaxID=1576369 RepID=A0A1I3L7C8_9PLAN|nr:alanine--glyoxylate aminotransferase family protein [Planctomicrobium piriforme]SFI80631.1 alanine-glyoxylate transaminase / serine-glyoxylate transaminase / serine-pyruvate transaminase [Planctomicrobium piriforme]
MAETHFAPFQPPSRILLGPGPSGVSARVLSALAAPTIGHLDPQFLKLMDETQQMLRAVFRTGNRLTLAVSGTGSAGMEACVVNLIEPGDRMLVCVNGVFGGRMADVAARAGAVVRKLERPFGEVFSAAEIEAAIAEFKPKVTGIVHAETSTGALQPVPEISRVVHAGGSMLLLDCVTSLAGLPVEIDEWEVDAAYSGTQKCLSCPPGLSPVTFSDRAVAAMDARKTKVASWYLDMSMVRNYWSQQSRAYHHTAPINMNYGLHAALCEVLEEVLPKRFARHLRNHLALRAGVEALGLEYAVAEACRLPVLNAVKIPAGVNDQAVRAQLLGEYGIEIGAGLGPMAGKTWRVGLMGVSSSPTNVLVFLAALESCLNAQGGECRAGAGVAAANASYVASAKS